MAARGRGRSGRDNGAVQRNGSSASSPNGNGGFSRDLEATIERVAETARKEASEIRNALEAEILASELTTLWRHHPLDDLDAEKLLGLGLGLVEALERHRDGAALVVLRALAAVAPERVAGAGAEAAERLVALGVAGPPWLEQIGAPRPIEAQVMHEELFDDSETVLVEFERPSPRHTIGVLIDHNRGGLAKNALLGGPLREVTAGLPHSGEERAQLDPIPLDEARARIEAAVERTAMTPDPLVDEDFELLRALVAARLESLPSGGRPQMRPLVAGRERQAMLEDFLSSPEGEGFGGDDEAADLAAMAIDFCCDYVDGRPLRWSPQVVELFMVGWLPRKCPREPEFFERVPEVLPAWIRYAGRRRELAAEAVEETLAGIAKWVEPMRIAARDEGSWGPAKVFAMAAQRSGVDLSDQAALEGFIDEYNAGLAADRSGAEPPAGPG